MTGLNKVGKSSSMHLVEMILFIALVKNIEVLDNLYWMAPDKQGARAFTTWSDKQQQRLRNVDFKEGARL